MKRRLFSLASLLSLLLCVATVVLWLRSHDVDDTLLIGRQVFDGRIVRYRVIELGSGLDTLGVAYRRGAVPVFTPVNLTAPQVSWYMRIRHEDAAKETLPDWARNSFTSAQVSWHYWNGFIVRSDRASDADQDLAVGVPHWFVAVLTSTLSLGLVVAKRRRGYRASLTTCRKCSYDLTGNTSGVCPECGTPIPTSWQ